MKSPKEQHVRNALGVLLASLDTPGLLPFPVSMEVETALKCLGRAVRVLDERDEALAERKVLSLPVGRTPQNATDMCEALLQSIERTKP